MSEIWSYGESELTSTDISWSYGDSVIYYDSEESEETKAYAVDLLLEKAGLTKAFGIDTYLSIANSKAYVIDSLLQKPDITKQFGIDTYLQGVGNTKAYIIDSLIQKTGLTKAFGIDTYIQTGTGSISGVTRSSNSSVLASCTVYLFNAANKSYISSTTSNASGEYTFSDINTGVDHFLRAHKDDSPHVFGTTDDDIEAS